MEWYEHLLGILAILICMGYTLVVLGYAVIRSGSIAEKLARTKASRRISPAMIARSKAISDRVRSEPAHDNSGLIEYSMSS